MVVRVTSALGKATHNGSQEGLVVHGRAIRVGANFARAALPFSTVSQSGCAASASAPTRLRAGSERRRGPLLSPSSPGAAASV